MKITGIIPARYDSSRFPGKPLAYIGGKTMIRRVYEQAQKAASLNKVVVATDDVRIVNEVKSFGGNVVLTSNTHRNGTERCAEVAANYDADVFVNIQGDEPFIEPVQIDLLSGCFSENDNVQIATLVIPHKLNEELQNPARVKVVLNKHNQALYFSRSIIPFIRDPDQFKIKGFGNPTDAADHTHTSNPHVTFYKHIGIYAYRKNVLQQIVNLPATMLERSENLEQLRWLENGYPIQCAVTTHDSLSVDTPEDLKMILERFKL